MFPMPFSNDLHAVRLNSATEMSLISQGNSVDFLRRRQVDNVIGNWDTIVDDRFKKSKNFYRKNLISHYGCVNAVEFSNDGKLLVSGGDDRRVLIWDVHRSIHSRPNPIQMQAEHSSNVFALALDYRCSRIFSGGNDDQVIVHDVVTGTCVDYFVHEQPVYGLSTDPRNDNVFASACDDGRVLIYDIREPVSSDPFCLAETTAAFHSVMYNPREPRLIVTANFRKGIGQWDVRMPKRCLLKYGGKGTSECCMSARFNQDGSKILALGKRLPPVLYSSDTEAPIFQFNHTGYYNSCTMKSCCFAGSHDEYVLSGSDNFDLYLWKIPEEQPRPGRRAKSVQNAHLVLQGHRSIVNQVRYNHTYSVIASSGVEKIVKLWSPFSLPTSKDGQSSYKLRGETERKIFSHDDYINLIMNSGQFMSLTYDTTRRHTREDPRMMAFFDALVQRDLKGMSEDESRATKVSYTSAEPNVSSLSSGSEDRTERAEGDNDDRTSQTSRDEVSSSSEGSTVDDESVHLNNEGEGELNENAVSQDEDNARSESSSSSDNESVDHDTSSEASEVENAQIDLDGIATENGEHILALNSESSSDSNKNNSLPTSSRSPNSNEDNGSSHTIKEGNIITRMIAAKQEHLMGLARAHLAREMGEKAAYRKKLREKVSTSSSSSGSSAAPSSSTSSSESSSDSNEDKDFAKLKESVESLLIKRGPSKRRHHASKPTKGGSTVKRRGGGSSANDGQRPCTSSSVTHANPMTNQLLPVYSKNVPRVRYSSTSSSDSDASKKLPTSVTPPRKKSKMQPRKVPNTRQECDTGKVSSTSSSSSSSSSSSEDECALKRKVNPNSFNGRARRLLTEIGRPANQELSIIEKNLRELNGTNGADKFASELSVETAYSPPISLGINLEDLRRLTDRHGMRGLLTPEDDIALRLPMTPGINTTQDSGIELSRTEQDQADPKGSHSGSVANSNEESPTPTSQTSKKETDKLTTREESSKRKNRHYRQRKSDSD